jgi:acetate---CoA ligase (ADP-forming)
MRRDLTKLFNPKSIAIIGASRSPEKLGHIVLQNILESGYKGKIFPVNPKAENIGELQAYADLETIPEIPQLAIIAIPAVLVIKVLTEIIQKGIKNVVIFTAGFKETGEKGKELEDEIIELSKKNKLNILGPNCLGFVNNIANLNATFGKVEKIKGNLKFISQSGAIATSVFDWAAYDGIGFTQFVTLGNKTVISESDVLNHWQEHHSSKSKEQRGKELITDEEKFTNDDRLSSVHPIGLYLESIEHGEDFLNIVSQITLKDPVFLLKPGKSSSAKKAMQSHTGAIAGEDAVLDAALKQSGVIRCNGIEDLFDLSKAFSWENAPEGPNVAIVSNAGGPAVISADFVEMEGLQLAVINDVTKKRLQRFLPESASVHNPIDVLGDALADRYANAIDAVLGQHDVHGLIVILTPQIMTQIHETAETIGRLSATHKKPIICSFMGGCNIVEGEKVLNMYKIPSYRFPERAIKALGTMWKWRDDSTKRSLRIKKIASKGLSLDFNVRRKYKVNQIIHLAQKQKRTAFNNFETNEILSSWDIKTPPTEKITSVLDALMFTYKHGWPAVLKLSSSKILHKSDLGGVITNITGKEKLEQALEQLDTRIKELDPELQKTVSIQIQKQVSSGVEVILGVKKDVTFGHVLMFGAGGTMAEILQDRNLQLLPIERIDAEKVVKGSKIYTILKGFRGEKPYALSKLYTLIDKIAELVETFPELEEFEINPVIVTHSEVWAVDGKGILTIDD